LAFSPDGTQLLMGIGSYYSYKDANHAMLMDARTGECIRTFKHHSHHVVVDAVAFSPDGRRVATASQDGRAKVWDPATGECIYTVFAHHWGVPAVAFSPDGGKLLTGDEGYEAKLWDALSGEWIRSFTGHAWSVSSVDFWPDNSKVLTGSGDGTAKVWDAETGECIRTIRADAGWVCSAAVSPDGTEVLTGGWERAAKLWDAATGEYIRAFEDNWGYGVSVAFSPDGTRVLTGSQDPTAKLWNAHTGECIRTFTGHAYRISSVAFSPNGTRVLTGSYDRTAKLWNAPTGECIRTFTGHTSAVTSVAFSPDGAHVLMGSYDGTAKLWDAGPRPQIPFTPIHPIRDSWSLSQRFGEGWGSYFGHLGEDYAAPAGTTVRSIAAGQVVLVHHDPYPGQNRGWGNAIIIRHELPDGQALYSQYAHLHDIYVCEGRVVAQGQPIGTVGSTGFTTGSHLHFEIKDTPVLGPGYSGWNFHVDEVVVNGVRYFRPSTFIQLHQPVMGDTTRVVGTMGLGLRLRAAPGLHAAILMVIPEGEEVALLGDVEVADGYVWRNVAYAGLEGWVAGEYLSFEPMADPPPAAPTELEQLSLEQATLIPPQGMAGGEGVMLSAGVPDDPGKRYKVQFEIRPLGTAFARPLADSGYVDAGRRGAAVFSDLAQGSYHWRARVLNEQGQTSEWVEFGDGGAADFRVEIVHRPGTGFYHRPPMIYSGANVWFISTNEDWQNLSFEWEIGGVVKSGPTVAHVFEEPGEYEVKLTVTDGEGIQASCTRIIEVHPGDIIRAINHLVQITDQALDHVLQSASETAEAADYFHDSVEEDAAKTVIGGVVSIIAGVLDMADAEEWLTRSLGEEVAQHFGAELETRVAEFVASKVYDDHHDYASVFIDPHLNTYIQEMKHKLQVLRDRAVAAAGSMTPEQAAAFAADLRERACGTLELDIAYERKAGLPITFGELKRDDENSWTWRVANPLFNISSNILLGVATGGYSGYARFLMVAGKAITSTSIKMAENLADQSIDAQMLSLCIAVLSQATFVADDLVENFEQAVAPMETADEPLQRPRGRITSICHVAEYRYKLVAGLLYSATTHYLNKAYSHVTIENTGDVAATFCLTSYFDKTFTTGELLPISTPLTSRRYELPVMDVKDGIRLEPGEQYTAEVWWLSEGGGGVPKGEICYHLSARTVHGFFLLDSERGEFAGGCTHFSDGSGTRSALSLVPGEEDGAHVSGDRTTTAELPEARLLPVPVRSTLISHPPSTRHVLYLHVSNPHDFPLLMDLSQELPADAAVLRTDGASLSGNTLLWNMELQPGEVRWFAVEFLSPALTQGAELPDASLAVYDVVNDDWIAFHSSAARVETHHHLPGDANRDCKVNILDLIYVRNLAGTDPTTGQNWRGDVNQDGKINILDLIYVRNELGTRCE